MDGNRNILADFTKNGGVSLHYYLIRALFLFLSTFMGIISHSHQFIKQFAVARLVCVSKQIPENAPFLSESLFFTSHSFLNHFNPQGAQTLAVISSAGASARAKNKTSVA